MSAPLIDIVIPVHTVSRPIARAVSSVLASSRPDIRAVVVCHNIEARKIAAELAELVADPRVVLTELQDGIPSPAGPLTRGVEVASAAYVGFLGSDDVFEPHALDCWAEELGGGRQDAARPDLLIGKLSSESAGEIVAPAPRANRYERLDAVRDLLNTRTAPVGALISRRLLLDGRNPGFTRGMRTGEDIALGLFVWNTAEHINYSRCGAGYLIREDSTDRATSAPLPAADVLAPVHHAVTHRVFTSLPRRSRDAIAVKLLRHQVLAWLASRMSGGASTGPASALDAATLASASHTIEALQKFAPGASGYLNRSESECLEAVKRQDSAGVARAFANAKRASVAKRLLTRRALRVLAPESPLGALLRKRSRRGRTPQHAHTPSVSSPREEAS